MAVVAGVVVGCFLTWNVTNVGAVADPLAATCSVSLAAIGLLTTALFVTHLAAQLPAGIWSDRYGARAVALCMSRRDRGEPRPAPERRLRGRDRRPARRRARLRCGFVAGFDLDAGGRRRHLLGRLRRRDDGGRGLALMILPALTDAADWQAPYWTGPRPCAGRDTARLRRRRARPVGRAAHGILRDARLLRRDSPGGDVRARGDRGQLGRDAPRARRDERFRGRLLGGLVLLAGIVTRPVGGAARRAGPGRRQMVAGSLVAASAGAFLLAAGGPLWVSGLGALALGLAAGLPFAAIFDAAQRTRPDAPGAAVALVNGCAVLTIPSARRWPGSRSTSRGGRGRLRCHRRAHRHLASRGPARGSDSRRRSTVAHMVAPAWPLRTERLLLRPFAPDDLDALYAIQSDEAVARWLYNEPRTLEETRELLAHKVGGDALRGEGEWLSAAVVLEATDELVATSRCTGRARRTARASSASSSIRPTRGRGTRPRRPGRCSTSRSAPRPAPRHRPPGTAQRRVRPRPREARHETRGAPRRERVGQGRMAERARVRDPRSRVGRRLGWHAPGGRRILTPSNTTEDHDMALSFGVTVLPDPPASRLVELMKLGEDNGFEIGWTYDSHVLWQESFVQLTLAIQATSRLKFGHLVTNPGTRDPTVLASLYATMHDISDGRMVMGIGRGDSARRYIGQQPVRVAEFERRLEMIKPFMNGKEVHWNDKDLHLKWVRPELPEIPMWVAGYGPKALAVAGRVGDGVIIQLADPRSSSGSWAPRGRPPRRRGAIPPRSSASSARRATSGRSRRAVRDTLVPGDGLQPREGPHRALRHGRLGRPARAHRLRRGGSSTTTTSTRGSAPSTASSSRTRSAIASRSSATSTRSRRSSASSSRSGSTTSPST